MIGPFAHLSIGMQYISVGIFMFVSGMLFLRAPLVPILVLSFFYLYGALDTGGAMPSFTVSSSWIWIFTFLSISFLILWLFPICFQIHMDHLAHLPAVQTQGWGWAWIIGGSMLLMTLVPVCLGLTVIAAIKFVKFFIHLWQTPGLCMVAVVCFVAGGYRGIMRLILVWEKVRTWGSCLPVWGILLDIFIGVVIGITVCWIWVGKWPSCPWIIGLGLAALAGAFLSFFISAEQRAKELSTPTSQAAIQTGSSSSVHSRQTPAERPPSK